MEDYIRTSNKGQIEICLSTCSVILSDHNGILSYMKIPLKSNQLKDKIYGYTELRIIIEN